MTLLNVDAKAPSDAELIARVRSGDLEAYGTLFDRHRTAANRLARQLVRGSDSDDLVSEAFAKVLAVLKGGGGPDLAFRAYLLTAVRRLHIDRQRAGQRVQPTDNVEQWDSPVPFQDPAVDDFERSAAARAFASLPERHQVVLWHLEVEEQKPAEVGVLLGLSPNAVSALAYRARESLRQAYLRMHLADTAGERCRWTTEHIGGYVRSGLSRRDASKVEEHLEQCARCAGVYDEISEVNGNLRGLLAPLLLGSVAVAYLGAGGLAGTTGALLSTLSKVGALVATPTQAVAAGGVAAATTAVAVVGFNTMQASDALAGKPPPDSQSQAGKNLTGGGSGRGSEFVGAIPPGKQDLTDGRELLRLAGTPSSRGPDDGSRNGPPAAEPTAQASPSGGPATTPGSTPTDSPTDPATTPGTTITTPPPTTSPPTTPAGTTSDLSVTASADTSAPQATTVTVAVGLSSPLAAADTLTLALSFPADSEVTPVDAAWSCGGAEGGAMTCTAPGDPAPAPLVVTVGSTQDGSLTAAIAGPESNTDPDSTNNSASAALTVAAVTEPSATAESPTE